MPEDSRSLEVEGQWWLPSDEGNKVAGILSYHPDTGTELRLIGTFNPQDALQANDGIYSRIHGLAGRKEFTLEDCFQKNYTGEVERISVQQVFKGTWFTEDDEPNADGVTADMRHLTQWVGNRGIIAKHYTHEETTEGSPYASLEVRRQPERCATLPSGLSIKLEHRIGLPSHTGTEQSLRERYVWRLEFPGLISTSDAIEHVSDLQDLVSIATGRVAEYDQLSFCHPDVAVDSGDQNHRIPITLFAEWIARDTSKKPGIRHAAEMFFTFDELGGIDGVSNWMESMVRHRDTLGRVMASRYRAGLFVEDRLFHRAVAIEAFGRTRIGYKNVKLPGALDHCCNLGGDLFAELVGDVDAWSRIVKSNRDDIGHHLGKRPNQGGSSQYFLAESLYWLYVVCALRESSAPTAVFERIQNHSEWAWLGPKVRAVVQAG
ncbi:hypothetical protein OHA37_25575 [Streptomyces sp. NBC_00335]|uniref:ApeA N-terminal domain 1-containing protein n=1 Tax=unclassified Streptomyces TaxID=2593676 RepID=UPI00225B98D8|nr:MULTISPECIES: hypothetical protein [unclassified Streptomyces]MCX5407225.1 hypothetical protein [Streptomyces sp. NBC_00086]